MLTNWHCHTTQDVTLTNAVMLSQRDLTEVNWPATLLHHSLFKLHLTAFIVKQIPFESCDTVV